MLKSFLKPSIGLLICAIVSVSTAQKDVLIPYRKGNLWGLVDTLGKFVLPPKYDQCQFIEDSPFAFQSNSRKGFVIQTDKKYGFYTTHEVVPPRFTFLRLSNPHFVEGLNAADKVEYFLNSGKRAVPSGWIIKSVPHVENSETMSGLQKTLFLECQTSDQLISLYILPVEQTELAQELIKGCSQIEFIQSRNNQVNFEVQRPNTDYEELLTFEYDINTKKWVNCNPKRPLARNNRNNEFEAEPEAEDVSSEGYYGTVEAPVEAYDDISGSPNNTGLLIKPPKKSSTYQVSALYSWKNDSLIVRFNQAGKPKVTRLHMPLPPEARNIKVLPYNSGVTNVCQQGDSAVAYSNFVRYTLNNKQVIQCFYGQPALAFDSLERFPVAGASRDVYFLAGELDQQGILKLGLINDSGKVALPLDYEHIETNQWLGIKDVHSPKFRLVVKKNGEYGFTNVGLSPSLEGRYDEIKLVRPSDNSSSFFSLRKGALYGVAIPSPEMRERHTHLLVEPKFQYAVSSTSSRRGSYQYPFYLFKCVNSEGQFVGFSDSRGRVYFED